MPESNRVLDQMRSGYTYPGGLKYQWVIKFKDQSTLRQFIGATENKFPADRLADFSQVYLIDVLGTIAVTVHLDTGLIELSSAARLWPPRAVREAIKESGLSSGRDEQFRCICFRRVRRHFDSAMREIGVEIVYLLGWQITLNNVNTKRIIAIDESGNYSLEE